VGGEGFTPQARIAEQQQRIAQGVGSGQLSPSETAHLERQEQGINRQVHADREAMAAG
jgi:hypothetical protein